MYMLCSKELKQFNYGHYGHRSACEYLVLLSNNKNKQALYKSIINKMVLLIANGGMIKGVTRKLENGLYELKVEKERVVYCRINGAIFWLAGFTKSTPRTPKEIMYISSKAYFRLCTEGLAAA